MGGDNADHFANGCGLKDLIVGIVCSDDVEVAKPRLSNAHDATACLECGLPVRCNVEENDVGIGFLQVNSDGGDLVTREEDLYGIGGIV